MQKTLNAIRQVTLGCATLEESNFTTKKTRALLSLLNSKGSLWQPPLLGKTTLFSLGSRTDISNHIKTVPKVVSGQYTNKLTGQTKP